MNIFKKALIVALSVGLISVPTVTKEVEAADKVNIIYLTPGDWKSDSAWFAAYFFEGDNNKWVKMTDENKDGMYEADVPSGYSSVIFCRMDSSKTALDWGSKWNQTCNLTVPTTDDVNYTITGWGETDGKWNTFYYNLVGDFSTTTWSDDKKYKLNYDGATKKYVYENLELASGKQFKIKRYNTWDNSYGYSSIENSSLNNLTSNGDGNFVVSTNAYYDIYLSRAGKTTIQQKYLLNFVVDGVENGSQYVKYNEGTFDKEDPIKDGYTFAGWFTSVDSNGQGVGTPYFSNSSSNKITSNVTLYAGWTQELTFTVSFNDNNGNISNTTVVDGEKISEPTTPTRTGFKFVGWYTSENEKYDFETSVTEDLSLYAKWEYAPIIGTKNYIYFENTFGWTDVNCYAWDSNGNNNASWPGKPMTKLNDTTYYIEYDSNHTNLIFNDGSEQTGDLTYNGNYYSGETVATVSGTERDFDSSIYFQNKIGTKENTSKVRFVGSLGTGDMTFDLSKYNEVGFILGSTVDGVYKTTIKTTTNVYTSVEVNGSTVTAANLESPADYVYLITVDNVPQGQTFDVTTYAVDAEGNTVYGETKTIYVYYEA